MTNQRPTVPPLPPTPPLVPHLVVDGAVAAIEFYGKAFGGAETYRVPAEDGKRLMHAQVSINGATVFLMDHFPEACEQGDNKTLPPNVLGGSSCVIHLEVVNCDEAYKKAISAGAASILEPWDAFWGARYAQVRDPFGHAWSLAHAQPVPAAR